MKEEKVSQIFACLVIIGMVAVVIWMWYSVTTDDHWDVEYIVVEGEVDEVIPVKDNDGSIEYYHVYFDTGEQYRIKISSRDIDFTVNSKLILELFYYPNRNDDFKYISQIVKVPDNYNVKDGVKE